MNFFNKKNRFRININPKESINPEDIFSDVASPLYDEINEKKLEVSVESVRFRMFFITVFALFAFLAGYLLYVNFIHGKDYKALSQKNAQESYEVGSSRGEIKTSDGRVVASVQLVFELVADPSKFTEDEIAYVVDYMVVNFENVSYDKLFEKLMYYKQQNFGNLVLLKNLSESDVEKIYTLVNYYPQLTLREKALRYYPDQNIFSHVLGYAADISKEDLAALEEEYTLSDDIGKKGVEYYFEKYLKGVRGVFAKFVSSTGEVVKEGLIRETIKGKNIKLTIDYQLQVASYEALRKSLETNNLTKGAVVVLNAKTGAVLALASMPDFNPNYFTRGLNDAQADAYFNNKNNPLFNRAVAGEYAVGSVIKPIIAAAALEEGVISANTNLFTKGFIEVPSIYDPSVIYRYNDWKNHGAVDMIEAIAVSSNVYFYTIGGGYENQKGLGIERIAKYLKTFNWGKPVGISFATEGDGLVPTPDWKQKVVGEPWSVGDTYNTSIGQGYVLATPLQVAVSTGVFASGGKLLRPFIVEEIYSQDALVEKFESDIINENFISPQAIDVANRGMRQAVIVGSSSYLASLPLDVAGKTGTAQTSSSANNAWFSGFGPYNDPEIVVTVLLEEGETSDNAVRVAYDIFAAFFEKSQVVE